MRLLLLSLTLLFPTMANAMCFATTAGKVTAVVELYTSEGCSSCPRADELLLSQIKQNSDDSIIYLSQHVPYWDYLGWKDPFALLQFQNRQYQLAHSNNTSVYTPQMFVNGEVLPFAKQNNAGMKNQVEKWMKQNAPINLSLKILPNQEIEVGWQSINSEKINGEIVFSTTTSYASSEVKRGENANRKLQHGEINRIWQPLGKVDSAKGAFVLPIPQKIGDDNKGKFVAFFLDKQQQVVQAVALNRECN